MHNQDKQTAAVAQGVMAAIAELNQTCEISEAKSLISKMFNAYVGSQDFEMLDPKDRMSDTFVFLRLHEFMTSMENAVKVPNVQLPQPRRAA